MDADRTRHTCHCGKSFVRREHLRRHQATHGERQHVCSICQRPFTRSDLLKRHLSTHTASEQGPLRTVQACDACYENKTKCDGGERCSLCTRRGITCIVSRGRPSNQKAGPTEEEDAIVSEDVDGIHEVNYVQECQDTSVKQRSFFDEDTSHLSSDGLARAGMSQILELLRAASACKDTPTLSVSDSVRKWVSLCTEAYFGPFHDRWALIHAPLFDETEDDLFIVSTVVMIGSILRDKVSIVRDLTLEVHSHLHDYCIKSLTATQDEDLKDSIWPYETYQLALLNIIAALELGKPSAIRNANRLLSFIIISMRENNIFSAESVERHQSKHFPGTFGPWIYMGRDRWRWQASVILQLDAYMSLFTSHPPFLRLEELDLGLLATYTLRNSHGLDMFFQRVPYEPKDRQRTKISDVAQNPRGLPASGPLVEDIQMGLSGIVTRLWVWRRNVQPSSTPSPTEVEERLQIENELDEWESKICQLFELLQAPETNPQAVSFLFHAYTGKEDPRKDGWEGPVVARISDLLFDISMFYYCLGLHLFAAAPVIHHVGAMSTEDDETRALLLQWTSSSSARQASDDQALFNYGMRHPSRLGHESSSHLHMPPWQWRDYAECRPQ
ncbi:unnamed protein product [Clonostachys solani]|uniref:Zn(2)-C6 fungal-type domain-containing protein n=1 Tax=Clonostachys solani TaxID=160281 RepID=A0A9N9Z0H9_9HYPO|nr:unnamed protein product [Clonostachys solani]